MKIRSATPEYSREGLPMTILVKYRFMWITTQKGVDTDEDFMQRWRNV